MSWKPGFKIHGVTYGPAKQWSLNGQAFATYDEAKKSALARMMVWTPVLECEAIESTEPVNYRWDDKVGDVSTEVEAHRKAKEAQGGPS